LIYVIVNGSVWSVVAATYTRFRQAWPHSAAWMWSAASVVTVEWSEIMGGYNTPDTVVRRDRRRK